MRLGRALALAGLWRRAAVILVATTATAGAALGQMSPVYDPYVEKRPPVTVAGAVSAKALKDGSAGVAVMDCLAAPDKKLSDCKIAFEAPAGYGFGEAAISRMADYRVAPENDGSPNRVMLAVDYRGARQLFEWDVVRPPRGSPGEKIAPSRARSAGLPPPPPPPPPADLWASLQSNGALVVHRCMIDAAGVTAGCEVVFSAGTTPAQLAAPYRYAGATAIPVPDAAPHPAYFSTVYGRSSVASLPSIIARPSSDQILAAYDRAGAGNGKVRMSCLVSAAGLLRDCRIDTESPAGRNLGAAALSLAPLFKLKPQMVGGRPVDGDNRISIPFTFGAGSAR